MLGASEEGVGGESQVLGQIHNCFRVWRELAVAGLVCHFTERETLSFPCVELEESFPCVEESFPCVEESFPCVEESGAIPSMTSYKATCRQDQIDSTAISSQYLMLFWLSQT